MFSNTGIISSQMTSPIVYPLDTLSSGAKTGATGLFSLKRLFTSYNGAVMNVRNGDSGIYTDVYSENNLLITPNGSTSLSWLNGATGYIQTWYDQSGN